MPTMPTNEDQSAPSAEESQESLSSLIASVGDGLAKLESMLADKGVPEELTSRFSELSEQYRSLLEQISQAAGGGAKPKPPGGMLDGNAGMRGVPMGP